MLVLFVELGPIAYNVVVADTASLIENLKNRDLSDGIRALDTALYESVAQQPVVGLVAFAFASLLQCVSVLTVPSRASLSALTVVLRVRGLDCHHCGHWRND